MMMRIAHDTLPRIAVPPTLDRSVLLIEDDEQLARALTRTMTSAGYSVVHVGTSSAATEKVLHGSFDAVISDLNLPGGSGVDVLNLVRAYDPDVPFVLMTGDPTVDTAVEAANLGVLEYLVKPTPKEQLLNVLMRATAVRQALVERRERASEAPESNEEIPEKGDEGEKDRHSAETVRPPSHVVPIQVSAAPTAPTVPKMPASMARPLDVNVDADLTRFTLAQSFTRAMDSLAIELEPIAHATSRKLIGFAARMTSTEESLTTDASLVAAAEILGRLEALRRRARDLALEAFASAPSDALLFLDVSPSDLVEGDLYAPEPTLGRIADRVVLQVRVRELTATDLGARASVLRFIGFRLAIADLDASQACLDHIATLSPEFVKVDARLVRGIDRSVARRRVVTGLISMCTALDAESIAEGVSTAEERNVLAEVGCSAVQGVLAVRHAAVSVRRPGLAMGR